MTTEELLSPRYKVIADYPHMALDEHGIGDIISPYVMKFLLPDKVNEMYSSFPHLFQKLEWWEERTEGELPKFFRNRNGVHQATKPLKEYAQHNSVFLPATLEEFNSQSK